MRRALLISVLAAASSAGCAGEGGILEPQAELGDITWSHDDLFCQDVVPVEASFRNVGEVLAKDVTLTVSIVNMNAVVQDSASKSFGSVAAGSAAMSASFSLFAPDACGRDDFYLLLLEVEGSNAESTSLQTEPFSI